MKPYIICHMMASVDGRIDCAMTEQIDSSDAYYEALDQLQCPTTIEGRKGMASVFDGIDEPNRPATLLKLQSVERMGDTVWMRYKV